MTRSRETQSETIMLELPPDLAQLLQQYSQRSGQPPAAVILAILKSALGRSATALDSGKPDAALTTLHALEDRLAQLEALMPRLEVLEGKLLAF
jgi:DNA repair exonuclease SbcCD ATPase subunit